jgi:hypothetical protein
MGWRADQNSHSCGKILLRYYRCRLVYACRLGWSHNRYRKTTVRLSGTMLPLFVLFHDSFKKSLEAMRVIKLADLHMCLFCTPRVPFFPRRFFQCSMVGGLPLLRRGELLSCLTGATPVHTSAHQPKPPPVHMHAQKRCESNVLEACGACMSSHGAGYPSSWILRALRRGGWYKPVAELIDPRSLNA